MSNEPVCWHADERGSGYRMLCGVGQEPGFVSLKIMGDTLECRAEDARVFALELLDAARAADEAEFAATVGKDKP